MISYFIVVHCTFTKKFLRKFKFYFQAIFGQDITPLKIRSVFCKNLRTVSSLTDGGVLAFTITLFYKKVSHLFSQALGLS